MIQYEQLLNQNLLHIKPSGIRKFFDLAEQMHDVISLGVGEPDFLTPWHIRRAAVENLDSGKTRYTANAGLLELRKEICTYVKNNFDLEYNYQNEVVVTVGGSEGIDLFLRAVINPGDEVIVPEPSFVCYNPIVSVCGGIPVALVTEQKNRFKVTAQALKAAITPKTKAVVLPFPNNPTGAIMERAELEEIAAVIRDTDILVLSDEIYANLTYGGKEHVSIASVPGMKERTVVVNGFSKTFSMTGWRLGYAMGPQPIIKQMTKLHQFAIMSAPTTSQYAAIEALRNGQEDTEQMKAEYDYRRRYIVNAFRQMGLECFEPEGAFYCFPSIQSTGLRSDFFCERLLKEKRVAVVPGTAFGESGEGFIRVSYCYSIEHIKTALKRIEEFLGEIKNEN
ncbi:MAG: aminotransferase class I/II-fold pyridoxal phosphate-dependent enzyme [Ruminococcaceae bacterium]|nr:aminotransferase class I/II-fold pyridoxal phosphate-dependent enzyme [Oscillospiraceae bacterium]